MTTSTKAWMAVDYRRNAPIGSVVGGGVEDFKKYFPQETGDFKRGLYRLSFMMHLVEVAHVMREYFPDDRVKVYYDRSREFGSVAKSVFDDFMNESTAAHMSKYYVDMFPRGWEGCVPLQPTDFIAYEGMKRLDQHLRRSDAVRKAFAAAQRCQRAHRDAATLQKPTKPCESDGPLRGKPVQPLRLGNATNFKRGVALSQADPAASRWRASS